jgi:acetolactate synthase-1/2/3 large subunit
VTAPPCTLGAFTAQLLAKRGVDTVFGIPGVHTIELYRGITDAGITHITPRHEQGAGFMADGYARISGKPGTAFVISGPGMTNILTAMGQAYADSIPMLVISAVNAHGRMGSGEGWLHELPDQRGLASGCAAFSRTIHTPDELERAMGDAFSVFSGQRPRPVHIEIPTNLLKEPVSAATNAAGQIFPPAPTEQAVAAIAKKLTGAKRPLILAGGGSKRAAIRDLAERLDAPVVMTTNGRGALPPGHALAVPVTPSLPRTRKLIAEADCVLALGTELGSTDYDFNEDGGFSAPGFLIRVDLDSRQASRTIPADMAVIADTGETVLALLARLPQKATSRQGSARVAEALEDIAALDSHFRSDLKLLDEIRDALPNAPIVGDSTQLTYAGNMGFAATKPGFYFNSATGFGTLGYGLPAAIGAAVAHGGPVICLIGDGGLQFCLAEMASAKEIEAPVIMLLHDNKGYGEIKSFMQAHQMSPLGVDIYTPDLIAIAKACGWNTLTPDRKGVAAAITEAESMGGPVMVYLDDATRLG